jgi:hypothetical protein
MEIIVTIKSVYGTDKVYPVCDRAKMFASIADTVTLTEHTISNIKALGYMIIVKQDRVTL